MKSIEARLANAEELSTIAEHLRSAADTEIAPILLRAAKLRESAMAGIRSEMKDRKLLPTHGWLLDTDDEEFLQDSVRLTHIHDLHGRTFSKLVDLLKPFLTRTSDVDIRLGRDAVLSLRDENVSIQFMEANSLVNFVNEYGLTVDLGECVNMLHTAEDLAIALHKLLSITK